MPQIVMSVRLPSNDHTTTLRTAKPLHLPGPGCEMENQHDRQHHVFVRDRHHGPSTARMYDYWLGGFDNFAADRAAVLKVSEEVPEAQLMAVENRRFLRRAVRYLDADVGITRCASDNHTGCPPGSGSGARYARQGQRRQVP
jgi:hypothetical protein